MRPQEYAVAIVVALVGTFWIGFAQRRRERKQPELSPTRPIVAACHDVHGMWWMCGGCGCRNGWGWRFCGSCGRMEISVYDLDYYLTPTPPSPAVLHTLNHPVPHHS